jgi:hypothetical protein
MCAEDELPRLRDGRAGAHADAADREGTPWAGATRPRPRLQILRSSPAVSPGPHLRAQRSGDRPLRHGGLGRSYGGALGAPGRADRASRAHRRRAPCRRYASSRPRSRPWPNENRPTMDGGERREPPWIDGAPGGLLSLLARSQGRARPRLAQGLSRPSPCRCLRGLRRTL